MAKKNDSLAELIAQRDNFLRRTVELETRQWRTGPDVQIGAELERARSTLAGLERKIKEAQAAIEGAAAAERAARLAATYERERQALQAVVEQTKALQAALTGALRVADDFKTQDEGSRTRADIPGDLYRAVAAALEFWKVRGLVS